MWSDVVVLFEPFVDDGLRLLEGREPLGIEDLASERSVKSFVVSVLPGASWIDLNGLDTGSLEPGL